MTDQAQPFALSISLNVLENLGINLYSNVPSVLSETLANAWDADAEEVNVNWDKANDKIIIRDNGTGMTAEEANKRFLTVGYQRRDIQPGLTRKNRHPMGRKGIGKLALFSIAGTVEIETVKNDEKSAFRMRLDDIRNQIENAGGQGTYYPTPISTDNIDFEHGTRITLTDLRKRQTLRTSQALRRRLARRFSIIGEKGGFRVYVDNQEVTPADRDYYDKVQYLWTYGPQDEVIGLCVKAEHFDRTQTLADYSIQISGWLGTVREVRHLKDEDGENLNRIAIFVRGKLAQEDILTDFSERGVYANYLIGEIRADALDSYDGQGTEKDDDAATSSRQRIVEDDERYQILKDFIGKELKYIQNEWQRLRAEQGAEKALEIPAVKEWMDDLKPATRAKARKWLGKINRIRLDDLNEQKQLIKHAVLAFEFYRVKENLDALETIDDENFQGILAIFEEMDNLEANLYGQIVKQRIEIITALEEKIDHNNLEKAIQKYVFDHLWLLDPGWERAEGTEIMERPVMRLFADVNAELTEEQKLGRLDIAYRKTAGQHVIIELKRPERTVSTFELAQQVEKYLSGMQRLLEAQGTAYEPVQFVLLIGHEPSDWASSGGKARSIEMLRVQNARIVFYEQLLRDARKVYQDYLSSRNLIDKLDNVIKAIEDYVIPSEIIEELPSPSEPKILTVTQ